MKKILLALAALLGPLTPAIAGTGGPYLPGYVTVVRVSSVPASPAKILAFQNTSATLDVLVNRIDATSCSTQTVTSGLMQFWVYSSTVVTHSVATTAQTYGYRAALATAPLGVTTSTAPLNVQYEGDSAVLTAAQQNALTGTSLPLVRPLAVNLDETATTSISDSWQHESPDFGDALLLPHAGNRALVIEKRQLAATDWSAGCVTFTIHYTLR